jgi:branched-chain amino acid transport system ATP-binding protein
MSVVLQVEGVTLAFSGLVALDDVSFDVREGELLAIIGPNGAGKTSIFNCLNGVYRPQSGRMSFLGGCRRTRSRGSVSRGCSRASSCSLR